MSTATIGSRYQVVIPAAERRQVGLKPHDKVSVEVADGAIIIKAIDARQFRGLGQDLKSRRDPVSYVREMRAAWGARS